MLTIYEPWLNYANGLSTLHHVPLFHVPVVVDEEEQLIRFGIHLPAHDVDDGNQLPAY
jgi:hypothetical protein